MIVHKIIYTVLLLLCCNACCFAQEEKKYVYEDSSILYDEEKQPLQAPAEDTVAAAEVFENAQSEIITQLQKRLSDTILRKNVLEIKKDSIDVIRNTREFAYANNLDSMLHAMENESKEDLKPGSDAGPSWLERFFASSITSVFFWSLAGIFLAFILYKLFFTQGFFQRQSQKSKVGTLQEQEEIDHSKADYDKLIATSVSNKNYRLATRYLYLQALQKLAVTGSISFAADKTNSQYLSELTGKLYKKEFASLMLAYEYTWYGEFEVDETRFGQIRTAFKNFNNQL